MKRIFAMAAGMFFLGVGAVNAGMKENEVYERLTQSFATLDCPSLADLPAAKRALANLFDHKDRFNVLWLMVMQRQVEKFSNDKLTFVKDSDDPTVESKVPHEHFMAFNLQTGERRKYIILKGAKEIACGKVTK